jgi:hypothetical protein
MRILVPSYGRAGHCSTMDLLKSAVVVVPKSQYEDYVSCYGVDRVIQIPDKDDGSVVRKRNAVLNCVDDGETFWMIDDDLIDVTALKQGVVEDIEQVLESHLETMKQLDCHYGGFNVTGDPVRYLEYQPFSMSKPSYQAVCIKKCELRYDEKCERGEDVDYALQVLNIYRMMWRDNRYFFKFQCNKDQANKKQTGGIEYSDKLKAESDEYLVKKWGHAIRQKDNDIMISSGLIKGV